LLAALGDVALDPPALHVADQRADEDVGIRGVADGEGCDRLSKRVDDVRVPLAISQHASLVHAGLAVVGHRARRERGDDRVEVGVG